jgi:Phenylacetic acid-responsive transcriptional repressor
MRARSTIFTLFVEHVYPERRAPLKALIAMMEALGFSEAAVRAALSRSARRGWVAPERRGRVVHYALSDRVFWQVRQVRRRLYEPLPPWDGSFLLVLPEGPRERGERERFRREMALLGYGSLQSGVYLGASADPRATEELLGFYGLLSPSLRGGLWARGRSFSGPFPSRPPGPTTRASPWKPTSPKTPWRPSGPSPGWPTRCARSSSWTPFCRRPSSPRASPAPGPGGASWS